MSTDLVTRPSTGVAEWHPKEEKYIKWGFNAVIALVVVLGGSILIKATVPTVNDALQLLQKMLQNGISTAITAGVLAFVLFVLYETFSSHGKINGLFRMAYRSAIAKATEALIEYDPITPLTDNRAYVVGRKRYFDEQFARFDGQISNLQSQEQQFGADSADAERKARAAQQTGNMEALNRLTYKAGTDAATAKKFHDMSGRLLQVRALIISAQRLADDTIYHLDIDITQTKATWAAQQQISAMEGAAREILKGSAKSDLARQAQEIVNTKYAVAIGRLENLSDAAKPLLENMDLENASFAQEYLDKWQSEAKDAQATPVTYQPVASVPMVPISSSAGFTKLIR